MNQSLLIIGPDISFRGVGGVTIHVKRLRDYLERNCIEYTFKDYKSNNLWTLMREIYHHRIIHIHISNPLYQFLMVFLCRIMGKKTIMTLHGDYGRFGCLKNKLAKCSLQLATVPIVINDNSYEICKRFNKRVAVIPAFIPPQKEEILPEDVVRLLDTIHNTGRKIYSTNASNVAVDRLGNDIYGIDFLVQYFKDSADKALVISDPSGNYKKRYPNLQSNSVFFINCAHSYYEVLKRADYSIRNTSTDGDSLSVKESLYLHIPTLCSDVVNRPKGVRLFKYCDKETFDSCLNQDSTQYVTIENGAERILRVYKSLLSD